MNHQTEFQEGLTMKTSKLLIACLATVVLVACGGGSSGSFDAGREARLTVSPMQSTLEAAAFECRPSTQVNVRFQQANGSSVADGTSVSLSTSSSAIGTVAPLSGGSPGGSASATTSGGTAQFRFFSGSETGQVTLTASGSNPSGVGTVTAANTVTVTESTCEPPAQAELEVTPLASSIEANPRGLAPNPQAPYTVQVNVSFRKTDGSVVANGTEVTLASGNASLGVISPIAAPAQAGPSASSPTSGGVASFWVTSATATGTLTLTASAVDPDDETGTTLTASASIEIVESSGTFGPELEVIPLSATVQANPRGLAPNPAAPYTVQVNVSFSLSNGDPVPDGTLVNLASGDSTVGVVSPLNAPENAGGVASAQTSGGVARFWFTSATQTGTVSLTASAANPEESGTVTGQGSLEVVPAATDFGPRLNVIPLSSSVEANPRGLTPNPAAPYTVQINVAFSLSNGDPVPDGTAVNLATGSSAIGVVSALSAPEDAGGVATAETSGGVARFWFTSATQTGTVSLTASAANPEESGTITGQGSLEVVPAATDFGPQLTVIPLSASVEANPRGLEPNPAAPYTVQVNVAFSLSNGDPVPDGTLVRLRSGSAAVGLVSPLAAAGNTGIVAEAEAASGVASFWFTSAAQTGTVSLTASAANPEESGTVTGQGVLEVVPAATDFGPRLNVIPLSSSVEANPRGLTPNPAAPYTVQINVAFSLSNGDPVPDGTEVNLATGSSAVGVVSPLSAPEDADGVASAETSGGVARFWFTSATQTGTVSLTASAANPEESGTVTGQGSLEVVPAATDFGPRLNVIPLSSSVEGNPRGLGPNPAAPYTVQVNVSFNLSNGDPVPDGTAVNLATGSSAVGVVSPLNAPEDVGGVATAEISGGVARFWFTSATQTGTVSLTASAVNPEEPGTITGLGALEVVPAASDFGPRLSVEPLSGVVEANPQGFAPTVGSAYTVQVNVQFTLENGEPVADGTPVSLSSADVSVGVISALDAPAETGRVIEATTAGGTAGFLFTSGTQTGLVTLTASAANPSPNDSGTIVGSASVQVLPASDTTGRLSVIGDSTMPTNPLNVPIFLGSPYINELTVRYRGPDGEAGVVDGGQISVAIFPIERGAFSTLDDPATPDVNEFFVLVGSGPVNLNAGVATIFVHSFDRPGPLTVAVQAVDADTGERFSSNFVIEVEDGAADFLPADISFGITPDPVYVQGSGGPTTKSLTLTVVDSGGNPVPNPEQDGNAFNNVRLQLDAPADSGARLTGTGAEGSVSGTDINVRTVNGIANFALNAGTLTGSHRITATVDRADNNVDNDFQDALSAQTIINVGDGRLFAVRLVSPILNAIRVNPTTTDIETSFEPVVDPETGAFIPPNPDGTYSLTVTAIATDQAGNPPLPGQTLSFGKIDAPTTAGAPRFFVFSGPDGDPEEGGLLFTAADPAEGFLNDPTRPDEAVEPGDTLALFGKQVPGNRQHEAVRTVARVIDDNTLTVTEAFNPNDGTGQIVDDGPVIPWVIGRSQVGFVDSTLVLDERGRGSVQLTYPINALGSPLVLWTQGARLESGGTRTVADVEPLVFPGVAPLILTASPSVVPGNTTSPVQLCLTDGLRAPINGVFIRGSVTDGTATGSLDGVPMSTTTARATGSAGAGCVVTQLTTTGLVPEGDPSTVTFTVGDAEASVEVVPPGAARLLVEPSTVTDNVPGGFTRQIQLRLLNAAGEPIVGVPLEGSCDGGDGTLELVENPGITGTDGRTTASVFISMAACGDSAPDPTFPRVGQCEFTTTSGTPTGLFTAIGLDLRSLEPIVSPPPPDAFCPPLEDPPAEKVLNLQVIDNRGDPGLSSLVTSFPGTIACSAQGGTCSTSIPANVNRVQLQAPAGTEPLWIGDCVRDPGAGVPPSFGTVATPTALAYSCTVVFQP